MVPLLSALGMFSAYHSSFLTRTYAEKRGIPTFSKAICTSLIHHHSRTTKFTAAYILNQVYHLGYEMTQLGLISLIGLQPVFQRYMSEILYNIYIDVQE